MANTKSAAPSVSSDNLARLKARVKYWLFEQTAIPFNHLKSTSQDQNYVVNTVLAQIHHESSLTSGITSRKSSYGSVGVKACLKSSAVTAAFLGTNSPKAGKTQAFMEMIANAWGLGQSMGYNHIKGSASCVVESISKTLRLTGNPLIRNLLIDPMNYDDVIRSNPVPPYNNMTEMFGGFNSHIGSVNPTQLDNQILTQLLILEEKAMSVKKDAKGYYIHTAEKGRIGFSSKMEGMYSYYLGLYGADANGTTFRSYAASIMSGQHYVAVTSAKPPDVVVASADTVNSGKTTGTAKGSTPGCLS